MTQPSLTSRLSSITIFTPGELLLGSFLRRRNRFIAECFINESEQVVAHVKSTGRMTELLQEGATVILRRFPPSKTRKTLFDLVKVYLNDTLISIDTLIPNHLMYEAFLQGVIPSFEKNSITVKREVVFGNSRFDIEITDKLTNRKTYVEVKSVTLCINGKALFPDAPTKRGTKHVLELIEVVKSGHDAYVVFVPQRNDVESFSTNTVIDPDFTAAVVKARDAGVQVLCYCCEVSESAISLLREVPVEL
ncbi:hypothetical protein GEMRC1_005120 [Eukaryota sp. GEM-RC1]